MNFWSFEKDSTLRAVIKSTFIENGLVSHTVKHWDPGWLKPSYFLIRHLWSMGWCMQTNNHNTV